MRFCDLFIAYKIGLKEIKSTIPFGKLPLHRKIAIIITYIVGITGIISFVVKKTTIPLGVFVIAFLVLIFFLVIESKKENSKTMLENYYVPYSQKRMNMVIRLLEEYNIDITNSESIDLIIQEAKRAQIQKDYIAPLKTPLKTLGAVVVPVIIYAAETIRDNVTRDQKIMVALDILTIIILLFSACLACIPLAKEFVYQDYNKYNELISDLAQIKIFYSKHKPRLFTAMP